MNQKNYLKGFVFSIVFIGLIVSSIIWGSADVSIRQVCSALFGWDATPTKVRVIIWEFRIPKILTALLAGGSLALGGLLMQTFFRNPIAGPSVLGISSGASLGAALWIMGTDYLARWGILATLENYGLVFGASLGAFAVLGILLLVSWRIRDTNILLILGLLFGSATNAFVSLLQFFSTANDLQRFVFWSMGNLGGLFWEELGFLLVICLLFWGGSLLIAKQLNILLLGENYARSMGIHLIQIRWVIISITAILVACITAFCGPIAFVGIIVPHLARMFFRTYNHYILIPATIALGAMTLLACQLIAQVPSDGKLLPINVVTSFLGAPVIILFLLKRKH